MAYTRAVYRVVKRIAGSRALIFHGVISASWTSDLTEYLLLSISDGALKDWCPERARRRAARWCKIVGTEVSGRNSYNIVSIYHEARVRDSEQTSKMRQGAAPQRISHIDHFQPFALMLNPAMEGAIAGAATAQVPHSHSPYGMFTSSVISVRDAAPVAKHGDPKKP